MIPTNDLLRVLECLEAREAELLCWGDTGGHFTASEFESTIESELPTQDPDEVEDELRRRVMIVPVRDARGIEVGVRTRLAEAVHLYRNLRQWLHGQSLDKARTLVSDYRFIRQSRVYPDRNRSVAELITEWKASGLNHGATERALRSLVGDYRLSGFQARATERILSAWDSHRTRRAQSSATIVCAGTGSGKTMAFYLPALSCLAADLLRDSQARVRILAIYPRTELLKDQFSEAWEQARKLDQQLIDGRARKIRIGALFRETPTSAKYAIEEPGDNYFHYRFLRCSTPNCRGEMRWRRTDIEANRECLVCHRCGTRVEGDEVALTRDSMTARAPDILFTTTEMLNQRISDSRQRHLFGIGVAASVSVPLVLLDEVHTYAGSSGAQTAMLLTRWMRLSGNRPHFVGLSATLRDAVNFFGVLTGTNQSRVVLVEPQPGEMCEASAEYLLALRGDPVSQTALLSTTIQAAMLTRRILDEGRNPKSGGVWGSKTFLFTDDLDVNNRLYANLADAEGWKPRGDQLVPNGNGPLAQYRNPTNSPVAPRKLSNLGQDWSVAKAIGFGLDRDDRASVSRTSSQDTGYDQESEVVVTTASLEVGFNDSAVGAVLQHKAPRGVASYLQRKGRAGRQTLMRPWMIIVLSDFGRDRIAYQQYENLIEPEIRLRTLPVNNLHILKMHAAQAVLDWLSQKVPDARLWNWLNRNPACSAKEREHLLRIIEWAMATGPAQQELRDYIGAALAIGDAALDKVLWQAPRSIVLEFLPTLFRRLESNWAAWSDQEHRTIELAEASAAWGSPVPEFIPDNLFSALDTPDLQIRLQRRQEERWNAMSYFQGLKEFAPGRISKRFAIETGALSDWLVPDGFDPSTVAGPVTFDVQEAFGGPISLVATLRVPGPDETLSIFQPNKVLAKSIFADKKIGDTSNAFLRWNSMFGAVDAGDKHGIPVASSWKRWLRSVTFLTHNTMAPLELIRYNTGSDATIKYRNGTSKDIRFDWTESGKPAGIGARLFVDAVRLEFRFAHEQLAKWLADESAQKAVRTSIFQDQLSDDPIFAGDIFAANWVFECFLTAVLAEVEITESDVEIAVRNVCEDRSRIRLHLVPEFLFQLDRHVADLGDDDLIKEQKLQTDLRALLSDAAVRASLQRLSSSLYLPIHQIPGADPWVLTVLGNTLAAAVQQAVLTLLPHTDEQSTHVDPEQDGDGLIVWLSEAESGGMGLVTELKDLFVSDPLKVLNAIYRSLQPGDYEQMDADLFAALEELQRDQELVVQFEKFRGAIAYQARLGASRRLRSTLSSKGFIVTHTFSAVLNSRILKPGSTAETDRQLHQYLIRWRQLEDRCHIEVPINVVSAVFAIEDGVIDDPRRVFERACGIQAMLWVRGATVRQASLNFYNRFNSGNSRTERLLGRLICEDEAPSISYSAESWLHEVHEALDRSGSVDLIIKRSQTSIVPTVLATLQVRPLDTRGLLLYPTIRSMSRRDDELRFRIELSEVIH